MNARAIEIDAETAALLEREARARGLSVAQLLSDLVRRDAASARSGSDARREPRPLVAGGLGG